MLNKIIVTVGLKGGGGKSTVCANLAMHLVDKGIPVIVYDADIQQTLVRHRQRELAEHPDAELPYQLLPFSTANADEVKSNMQKLKEVPAVILIDCPGNINDACLQHIYAADLAVVPTRYDFDNLDTTILFADLFVQICKAKMLFIPNCISEIELRRPEIQDARNNAKDLLEVYGDITPRIKQCVTVKCYSTIFPYDKYQRNAVKFAFEKIVELIDLSYTTSPSLWCDFYSQCTQNSQRNIEMIKIITYSGQYKADFIRLNTEWIETYFSLEESDLKTFSHIDSYIIDNGGQIFLALDDNTGEVVGCCALINHPDKDSYELAKMAVSPHTQGHHIGHQLGTALIDYARKIGAKRLYLEGNTKLEASIHLYRKLGFHEISLEGSTYDRCDIIMELKL